jgi:hypothetical protein
MIFSESSVAATGNGVLFLTMEEVVDRPPVCKICNSPSLMV